MRKLYLLMVGLVTSVSIFSQTTYLANGPINGQGPLLSTENTVLTTDWIEIHPYDAGGGAADNSWSTAQAMPFAFNFFGTPVTQFCVSKNYLLTFDASVASTTLNTSVTTDNTALPNVDLPNNTIAYFWGGFGTSGSLGTNDDIWMKTFGTAPNRQLWIKNFSYAGESQTFGYNILVLEETSNKIYVIDTRWATASVGSYTVGLQKDALSSVEHPSSPNISSINTNNVTWDPVNIYYYEFLPFIPSTNDALVSSIDSPSFPLCNPLSNVQVTIGSNGAANLTSATLNWSVNSVLQTPVAWTGNIPQFSTESGISLGSYSFSDGDILKVWTSNPNGAGDGDLSNDTLEIAITLGLSGTKTIGATGDYLTFNDALLDLNQYGVCGNLVFNVQNGTYTEQLTLNEIPGMSSANTVTFQSLSGDSTDVVLTYTGTGTADNFVVKFDGADYITFKDLTLFNSSLTGYCRVLDVGGNSTNNSILNCEIFGDKFASTTSTNLALIYSTSTAPSIDSDWLFDNNRIVGGSYGVYWYGQSTTPYQEKGTVFSNNQFESNYYRGVRLYYQEGATFINNSASYDAGYGTSLDVFYFGYCDSGVVVTGNYVYLDSLYGDAITLSYCETSSDKPSIVANNQVIVNAPNTSSLFYATYLGYSDFVNFYHNSVYMDNTSTTARSFYSTGGIANQVVNNIFVNNGLGYAIYYVGTSVTLSDYNDVYAPNGNFGYLGGALATYNDWQLVTGMDANSLNINPMFTAIDDLHTCEATLDAAAMPNSIVATDFDGEPRSTTLPDIGADEFFAPENILQFNDTSKCVGQPVLLGGYDASPATYLWSNGSTDESINVTLPGTYDIVISGGCGFAHDTIEVTDIPAPTADFTQSTSFLTAILTDQSSGATSWSWNFGDGGTSTLQNPIYVYDAPGVYTITLTVTNECGSEMSTQDFTATIVGIDEMMGEEIRVFPNPASDQLTISFTNWEYGNVQLEIIDLSGKIVSVLNAEGGQQNFVETIQLDNLESGIYMIKFLTETGSSTVTKFEKL